MIVIFGLKDNQLHSHKGFTRRFDTASDADAFLNYQCSKINIRDIHRYAIYIGDETTSLDAVLHLHNWKNTNERFREENKSLKEVDIAQIKLYYDLEYQRQQQKQALHRAERAREISNMDAAAIEYHKKLFQDNNVNLF